MKSQFGVEGKSSRVSFAVLGYRRPSINKVISVCYKSSRLTLLIPCFMSTACHVGIK